MKLTLNIQCPCGNSDVVLIRKGKDFPAYDIFTEEFALEESINQSGKFRSRQFAPDENEVTCKRCNKEMSII